MKSAIIATLWATACTALVLAPCAMAQGSSVLAYHGSAGREGHFVVPGLDAKKGATIRMDGGFDGHVQGHINAQPLFWKPDGADHGLVIVATDSNVVEALDAVSGKPVWRRMLGPPAGRSLLSCGNIVPVGVAGTPVIDPASRALYLDAVVDQQGAARHLIFGLSLKDGSSLPGWPLSVSRELQRRGVPFDDRVQEERGALLMLGGRIYVPYGGYNGDCGDYYGQVVALDPGRPGVVASWRTQAPKGGIWAPAGLVSDGTSVIFATGNTEGARSWSDGEAIFRLDPNLHRASDPASYFTPADWRALDETDADLGGTAPTLIALPNATPSRLLLGLGKNGKAYLLDLDRLGGVGHELASREVSDEPIRSATATYPSNGTQMVVVQAHGRSCRSDDGLLALRISARPNPTVAPAWCAALDGRGAPVVTTSDDAHDPIVWAVGAEGDDKLHAYRGDTGAELFARGPLPMKVQHFSTILVADRRLYVAGNDRVVAFEFDP